MLRTPELMFTTAASLEERSAGSARCTRMYLFKQKTAYELTASDWSSDVCSSDLRASGAPRKLWYRRPSAIPVSGRQTVFHRRLRRCEDSLGDLGGHCERANGLRLRRKCSCSTRSPRTNR